MLAAGSTFCCIDKVLECDMNPTPHSGKAERVIPHNIALREMKKSDINQVRVLNNKSLNTRYNAYFYTFALMAEGALSFIAETENGYIVGCVTSHFVDDSLLYVRSLAVDPLFRRTRVATQLLSHLIYEAQNYKRYKQWFRAPVSGTEDVPELSTSFDSVVSEDADDGVLSLQLHVESTNVGAVSFYKNQGFTCEKTLAKYYNGADGLEMVKTCQ